ncbi:MAG: endolytic transglycosylase MltG [Bryobacteraceae bacterium]
MARMIRRVLLLLLLVIGGGASYVFYTLSTPYAGFDKEAFVDIPPGTSTRGIARMLEENGVIRSQWVFLAARALRQGATLKAGEYHFDAPAPASEVLRRIAAGDIFYYELTVPEGSNQFDIAASLEQLGLMKSAEFRKVATSPALIQDLAPDAPSLEGFLFPATYRLTRHTSAQQLAKEMTGRFRRAWKELNAPAAQVNRTVTLASLVEKETGVAADRATVASVFENRLTRNMTLDCDPTTIYAALLENRYRGKIYRSDLNNTNPYNTYRHPGLPPGPIANPGLASLKAAIAPAETEYLYFVAKGDGSGKHTFSTSLAEHNTAVAAYRNGQQH